MTPENKNTPECNFPLKQFLFINHWSWGALKKCLVILAIKTFFYIKQFSLSLIFIPFCDADTNNIYTKGIDKKVMFYHSIELLFNEMREESKWKANESNVPGRVKSHARLKIANSQD